MLVISNGAFKSGSTWIFMILRRITKFPPPPKEYLNPQWVNPSLHPEQVNNFLNNFDYSSGNYLCKNHFGSKRDRDLILCYPNVFVLGIKRDIRDVVVSAYYHHKRVEGYQESFEKYYWEKGRKVAKQVIQYNKVWDCGSDKTYISAYEDLKVNFNDEVRKIGNFLGITLDEETIDLAEKETSINVLKHRSDHFRKGIIGDWKNYFDAEMVKDSEMIQKRNGFRAD
jgi:hypothetical protein